MQFCCRCPECVALSSVWHDLAQKFNNNNNSELGIAKADCSLQTQFCRGKGRIVVLTAFLINIYYLVAISISAYSLSLFSDLIV